MSEQTEVLEAPCPPATSVHTLSVQSRNVYRGNSLALEMDPPVIVNMQQKGKLHTGWLIPYIICGDAMCWGRWTWWLEALINGEIPDGPLPQIGFVSDGNSRGCSTVRKHLNSIIEHLSYKNGGWSAVSLLLDWLLWGIGEGNYPDNLSDEDHDYLYRTFQAGLLQQTPHDYWGDIISESKGRGASWNPTAFFPTPQHVVEMIVTMNMTDCGSKGIFSTVMDPCTGTGRFGMSASNRSIFIFAQDIDYQMVKCTKLNFHLYAPWAALPVTHLEEPPYYRIPDEIRRIAGSRYLAAHEMMKEIKRIKQHSFIKQVGELLTGADEKPEKEKKKRAVITDAAKQPDCGVKVSSETFTLPPELCDIEEESTETQDAVECGTEEGETAADPQLALFV